MALYFAGCQPGLNDPRDLPALDEPFFRCRVQPVIAKSCATFTCHGDGRRFYRVYARNRLRLGGDETTRNAPLSAQERAANFESAIAMIDPQNPLQSFWLLKPLELAAGGYYHRGAVIFNAGNVFHDRGDPDFQTLNDWVNGAREDPACVEPGSNQ
ncbi:MAG TPA: hypothetical protein VFF06_02630 [Polyangia bacterium]|nr:hypothetical protein [Polyangia bacterium]